MRNLFLHRQVSHTEQQIETPKNSLVHFSSKIDHGPGPEAHVVVHVAKTRRAGFQSNESSICPTLDEIETLKKKKAI